MKKAFMILLVTVSVSQGEIYYVVNALDESLGWVNTINNEYEAQAVTLGNVPNDVVATQSRLFVVNSGLNTLQVIDRLSLTTLNEIELVGTVNPWAVTILDDHRAAVTGLLSGTLTIVNLDLNVVDTTFSTGVGPQALAINSGIIYVLNTGVAFPNFNQGVLKRYDSSTYALIDSVVLGINPQAMDFANSELHVICTGNYDNVSGSLQIVDLETMTVARTIPLGGSPGALSIFGAVGYIAAGGWGNEGFVFRYDVSTGDILNDVNNPLYCGVGATDISALPGGGFAVSCFQDATLEIRGTGGEFVNSYPMSAGASAITWWTGPTDVTEPIHPIATNLSTISAYPNPFNGTIVLEWAGALRQSSVVIIADILGRVAARLEVSAGLTSTFWNPGVSSAGEVAAGVYFARFESVPMTTPIRIVYLK